MNRSKWNTGLPMISLSRQPTGQSSREYFQRRWERFPLSPPSDGGERAGMREVVKPASLPQRLHCNRRRSSAESRESCQMVLMTISEDCGLMAK